MSGTSEGPAPAADPVRPAITDSDTTGSPGTGTRPPGTGTGAGPVPPAGPHCGPHDPFRTAFAAAPLAMAVLDREGVVTGANETFGMLLGATPGALTGRPAADLVDLSSDTRTWHAYREVLGGRETRLRCTRRLKQPDGRSLWAQITVEPLPGSTQAVLLSVADISARRELQARLRHLQMHDAVTRLPNRTLFFERLTAALEPESYELGGTGRVGLCYLDLDGFKAVNDTLGHHVGDQLLAAVAERLTRCAGEAGFARSGAPLVARLGGDEFALLVEDSTGTDQLADLAESVLTALQAPFDLSGRRLFLSASIGVVERHAAGTTATALMQAADTTLFWAQEDGRSRWTLFDPERNANRMTRQALAATLRPAIERGEFVLEYQPLVGMADDRLHGVEALIRWNHPQFGMLTPNRFIALAEEDGAIVPLGRWILAAACHQARRWQLERPGEPPIFVSVNVAVRQVWDSDLVSDVAEILAETGLAPRLLQLELTESAVMGSAGRPLQTLHALSEMGVRIAIDDFGTGYSNLAYLSRLPVDALKLDGSFVRGFQYDADDADDADDDGGHGGHGSHGSNGSNGSNGANGSDPTDGSETSGPDRDTGGAPATAVRPPNPADEVIVEAMVQLAHRLGLTVTAECVETSAQASRLRRIGCDTGQGWLYSRPVSPDRISALLAGGSAPQEPSAAGRSAATTDRGAATADRGAGGPDRSPAGAAAEPAQAVGKP